MASSEEPPVRVVVLAGGDSRRFGPEVKQLAPFRGEPLLRRVCRRLLDGFPLLVVLGHEAQQVGRAIADLELEIVVNRDWPEGQASSVRCGVDAVRGRCRAAVFVPADQPFVDAALVERLAERWSTTGLGIVVPRCGGRRGAPVLFDARLFDELAALAGDEGGRQLLRSHPEQVAELELDDERALLDADDPERLAALADVEDPS